VIGFGIKGRSLNFANAPTPGVKNSPRNVRGVGHVTAVSILIPLIFLDGWDGCGEGSGGRAGYHAMACFSGFLASFYMIPEVIRRLRHGVAGTLVHCTHSKFSPRLTLLRTFFNELHDLMTLWPLPGHTGRHKHNVLILSILLCVRWFVRYRTCEHDILKTNECHLVQVV